jgi:hypothetical protein
MLAAAVIMLAWPWVTSLLRAARSHRRAA